MTTTSETGLALIRAFEGLRLAGYLDSVKVPTIGWGHTSMAGGIITYEDGTQTSEVIVGKKISRTEADRLKARDTALFEKGLLPLLKRSPRQHQFDAMVSLAFNAGLGNFKKSSVLRHFNAGRDQEAGNAFLMWNKAGGKVLAGLTRRREAERALFLGDLAAASRFAGAKLPEYPTQTGKPAAETAIIPEETGTRPDDNQGTPAAKSTTIWAQGAAILSTLGTAAAQAFGAIDWKVAAVLTTGAVAAFAVYTISERMRHARESGV